MNRTTIDKIFYTFFICMIMEFCMAYYNYFFHTKAFLHEAFLLATIEFLPAFIIGFICEWFIVSKVAKRIYYFLSKEHFKKRNIAIINEVLIAIGMISVFTIYGAILHNGESTFTLSSFLIDYFKNAIFGIPFFLFVVHPIALRLAKKCGKVTNSVYNRNKKKQK